MWLGDLGGGPTWAALETPVFPSPSWALVLYVFQSLKPAHHINEPVCFRLFASVNQGLCLDAEVALATGQLLAPNSHQSSSAASHCSESRGETPCSFNDEDEEEDEEDSSSPE